ncbi:putative flavin-containing polyamine oxidase [Leptodontidium sp. MPI-SDFR-AT-0119]|nr:putative flavin-containing polyamine oxidase [Leptodontidium sp. MPI-SDFR-AT-0119]
MFLLSVTALIHDTEIRASRVCQRTKVVVLGAGIAGIAAAQALSQNEVEDFIIIEYNAEIGGRCRHTSFGGDRNGDPYTVELGANWVQGTVTDDGPENPIWTLAKKHDLRTHASDSSSLLTYDPTGQLDYVDKLTEFDAYYSKLENQNGRISTQGESQQPLNLHDMEDADLRSALSEAGYNPEKDPQARTAEWYKMDYEYAQPPELSSRSRTLASHNSTFRHFSPTSHFSLDPRGFNTIIHSLASTYLNPSDPRLHLSTIVRNIAYSPSDITVHNTDGSCITASHAVTTFSLGVLKSSLITFSPPLPDWKASSITKMSMGTYTKIFMQFPPDEIFWNTSTEFFLYASTHMRGYYPLFQSLSHEDFLPGSGILVATVTSPFSSIVESQPLETTKGQVMDVLKEMFGVENVPEPTAFMLPKWGEMEWAKGSFSNWPPGFTISEHDDLRRAVGGRLWWAGEHTSRERYGYLHGAFDEGRNVGTRVARCVNDPESRDYLDVDGDEEYREEP